MTLLESCKLFRKLSAAEMAKVRQVTQEKSFASGDVIFKEGDAGDGIYVVKSGIVQISFVVGQDEQRKFSEVPEGDMFGEMAVMDDVPRSATATAAMDTVVYFIARDTMLTMLESMPRLTISLTQDISRRLRDFNKQYVREVIQSERLALVGRFARSIVHDLKNPLNIIGIAADLAGMESSTPESRQAAKHRIRKQVDRISNMVNELLEFTRGSQSSFILSLTDYATFIQQLVEEVRPELATKNVSLEIENPPPSVRVPLNPQRMSRVFINLMYNATDAMPGGGKIILRFQVVDQYVVTEIEDTGSGVAPQVLDKVFEAFVTFGKSHGTGLGLSISKRIIEDHQGHIQVRNRTGGGAIFSFTLPLQKP